MSSVRWKKHPCTRTLETFCCADIAQLIWTFARPGTVNELVASAAPAIERARDVSLPEHMTRLQLRKRAERAMHHLAPVRCQELYDTAKAAQHKQLELEPDAASKRDLKRILDVEQIDSCFRCQRKSEEIAKLKILLFNARYNEYNE